ncbi:MAG: polyphosphate polymerase domain-containing protein [Clostridia bacterium]|nr:polyphosphate polymerase domain-containing protein [Clostridia bacterium]
MPSRHEEKFLIDYREYAVIRSRAEAVMFPDPHGDNGSQLITSLYFDDRTDTALLEKLDGIRVHTKYRVRTYDCGLSPVQLERKVKRGIMTEKHSATITPEAIGMLSDAQADFTEFGKKALILATEMRAKGQVPAIIVRYRRDAFEFPEMDCRLTFDTCVEALSGNAEYLFDDSVGGIPALPRQTIVMEVKYGDRAPAFLRKLAANSGMQLSVSKYALCREVLH